jgi:hypothetical protein
MKYGRFEDLPVWKDAIELAVPRSPLLLNHAFAGIPERVINLRMPLYQSRIISQKGLSEVQPTSY